MSNLIADGIFQFLPTPARTIGPTTGAYITKDWFVGPGVGGIVGVSGFSYLAGNILNLEWSTPPGLPGVDPNVDGQETILEYHAMGQVPATSGKTLRLTFQAMVGAGSLDIVPIVWVNYRDYRYWVDLGPRITIPYQIPNTWTVCVAEFTLPSMGSRIMDSSEYVGVGLDYPAQPGGQKPFQLLLYGFSLEIV